ncbi:hypothetical protein DV737_g1278, partial [Chaetothyriales sp. CBS 132003]
MSDVDDDMDLDGPAAASNDIVFSSNNTNAKGKRIVADLPIEASDNLPWVEKYRPSTLDDVSGHQDIISTINRFIEHNRLPHLLLYGPPGTGKTSTILALARQIYGTQNMRQMVLELNASDDRGIDVMALRRIMEKYTANTRFCIIANYTHKLTPALLSRCTRFRFSPLKEADIRRIVTKVVADEQVNIADDAVDSLVRLSKGDMRRALNVLQACHAGSRPLPIRGGEQAVTDVKYDLITNDTIYQCIAAPNPEDIRLIMTTLLSTPDVTSCLNSINAIKQQKGLALADILTGLAEELNQLQVNAATRVKWLEGLAEIEYRLAGGGSEGVQTGGMVGVLRQGADLMGDKGVKVGGLERMNLD